MRQDRGSARTIHVRDSKYRDTSPRLALAPPAWSVFVAYATSAPGRPQSLTASAICRAASAGVRCVVSTTSASACSHVRAASA
ncbi:DUF397 domain-containing protein [Streptomyces sp. AC550_RSS872]|uniref:DUF397 domain-containing protein n=1 Tax=Streptomyces sp. AC550_RSS872 TaxID=2823689 RepID=UPI0035ABE21C